MPPYEIERKFLIRKPDLLNLGSFCKIKEIAQTYLSVPEGTMRVRRTVENGIVSYTETLKRGITSMRKVEIERTITESEYERRLSMRDPRRQTIHKTRYLLPYNGHTFEIDIYPFWSKQAVMEIELSSEDETFTFPPLIKVLREVTDEPRYSNHSLAREIPPEDPQE